MGMVAGLRMAALCLLAGCISPVMTFGEGKTRTEAQRDTMADFGPRRLATGEKWPGDITTKKVRVWANNQYRAQNVKWQESFDKPLELANIVLESNFGLRLVPEYATWERDAPNVRLGEELQALHAHDAAGDVFATIGLTSSLPLVSATFDELGMAALGGRHMILRGYADLEERKMYANAFPDLRADERELALDHLRHHKTAVVLLHEVGHLLGYEHDADDMSIMHGSYSNKATAYSSAARATMLATVDQRLGRKSMSPIGGIPAAAPQSNVAPPPPAPAVDEVAKPPVTIRVTRKKTFVIDGKTLDAKKLEAFLRELYAEAPATKLVIAEDKNLPAGTVGDLMDLAKGIGFKGLEFAWSGH